MYSRELTPNAIEPAKGKKGSCSDRLAPSSRALHTHGYEFFALHSTSTLHHIRRSKLCGCLRHANYCEYRRASSPATRASSDMRRARSSASSTRSFSISAISTARSSPTAALSPDGETGLGVSTPAYHSNK